MEEKNNAAMVGALMLVAGGIIGAGVALLFAPQSGKRTRRDIARYTKRVKHKAEEAVDDLADAVSELAETVSDKTAEIVDRGKDYASEKKKEILEAIEEGQAKLEKQKNKLAKLFG
jgi:gas vesicle protein